MNQLNSVLLEGSVTDISGIIENKNSKFCCFTIATIQYFKTRPVKRESFETKIKTEATEAERCHEHLKIGSDVRIIGRLTNDGIIADHVEFKSEFKKPKV